MVAVITIVTQKHIKARFNPAKVPQGFLAILFQADTILLHER
ncbi:hypothetical protein RVIR1_02280 [Candidatus Rickettsiella viridis]|uniref:Uncharacterized protein n=1 Tax=Candidatus Rickettsiella viridis TaxID=676208 RepID=A0A2Z5V2R8_9COXI|nr:hypothetical protein RVIR1_02280 [Candidatus Rickettsiella viridis]